MEFQGGTGPARRATPATRTSAPTAGPPGAPRRPGGRRRSSTSSSILSAGPGRVVHLAGVRADEVPDQGGRDRRLRPAGPRPAQLGQDPLRGVDLLAGRGHTSGPTPAAARPPRPRAPAWASTPTSSATSSASATTTTTRTACRCAGRTPASGRCSAAAASTAPAARTAAGMIPPTGGGSMGAQHMLRNKIKLGMVDEEQRAAPVPRGAGRLRPGRGRRSPPGRRQPGATGLTGVNIALDDGDRARPATSTTDPLATAAATTTTPSRSSTGWAPTPSPPTPACCWPRPRTPTGRRSSGWSTPTRRTST